MRNSQTKSEKTLLLKGSHYKVKLAKFVYMEKKQIMYWAVHRTIRVSVKSALGTLHLFTGRKQKCDEQMPWISRSHDVVRHLPV